MSKLRINAEGIVKLIFSIGLFIFSIIVSIRGENKLIFLPMLFSMIGDISIMSSRGCITGKRENTFNYGIVAFAFAHILYIENMQTDIQLLVELASFILFIFVFYTSFTYNKIIPSIFYAFILLLNLMNAIYYDKQIMWGLILFIVSDTILAIWEDKNPLWQVPIWVFYVLGQFRIISRFLLL